jgi:hypothetical protein
MGSPAQGGALMSRRYWNDQDDAKLRQMRADRISFFDIGIALDRTEKGCIGRMEKLQARDRLLAAGEKPTETPKSFTDAEVATLLRMRDVEKRQFWEIDAALGRRPGVSSWKYKALLLAAGRIAPRLISGDTREAKVSAKQIADRDARLALSHPNVTAAFFGDPLPGHSALDLRSPLHTSFKGERHASNY